MKKKYSEPEFDLYKFRFGSMMEGGDDTGFENLVPSDPQGYGESHGHGLD